MDELAVDKHAVDLVNVADRLPGLAVDEDEIGALARATLVISQRAYATAGVTNREPWVTRLKRQGLTRRHWRFAVFDRAGAPCLACGATIERIEVGTRRLYLCPGCQPSRPVVSRPK